MAITVTSRGAAGVSTLSNSYAFSPSSDFTSGSFAVLLMGYASAASQTSPTITDTDTNTWSVRTAVYNGGSIDCNIMIATCDALSLTTADTITVTWGGNTSNKGYYLFEITTDSGGSVSYNNANSATFSSNGSITSTSIKNGNVIFGLHVKNGGGTSATEDSDTTNGSWSAQSSGNPGGFVWVGRQYKIVNADGTQTYNITTGFGGAIGWIEIAENAIAIDPFGWYGVFGI